MVSAWVTHKPDKFPFSSYYWGRFPNVSGTASRSFSHSMRVLLRGFHLRSAWPLPRRIEIFIKKARGNQRTAEPMMKSAVERTPAKASNAGAIISGGIVTIFNRRREMVKRSSQFGQKKPIVLSSGTAHLDRSNDAPQIGHRRITDNIPLANFGRLLPD